MVAHTTARLRGAEPVVGTLSGCPSPGGVGLGKHLTKLCIPLPLTQQPLFRELTPNSYANHTETYLQKRVQ